MTRYQANITLSGLTCNVPGAVSFTMLTGNTACLEQGSEVPYISLKVTCHAGWRLYADLKGPYTVPYHVVTCDDGYVHYTTEKSGNCSVSYGIERTSGTEIEYLFKISGEIGSFYSYSWVDYDQMDFSLKAFVCPRTDGFYCSSNHLVYHDPDAGKVIYGYQIT